MESITSRDNRRIKEAARLGADRSFREEQGRFLLEGLRLCADVAATTGLAQTLFVTSRALERHGDALAALLPLCKEYFHITEEVAAKLSDTKSPQGVFCICARPEPPEGPSPGEQILLLERVSDPGNLGTILRTAEAFGVSRLIVSSDSADCGCKAPGTWAAPWKSWPPWASPLGRRRWGRGACPCAPCLWQRLWRWWWATRAAVSRNKPSPSAPGSSSSPWRGKSSH